MKVLILWSCFNGGLWMDGHRRCGKGPVQGSGVWWPLARWASAPGGALSSTSPASAASWLCASQVWLPWRWLYPWCILSDPASAAKFLKVGIAPSWLPSHGARKAAPEPGLWAESWQRQGEEAAGGPREPCVSSGGQSSETPGPGARPVLSNMATTSPMWLFKFH